MESGEVMENISRNNPDQIIARRIDYPEMLSDFAASFWGGGVSIYDFSGTARNGIVEIRLVVDRPEVAREILTEQGWYLHEVQKAAEVASVNAEAHL